MGPVLLQTIAATSTGTVTDTWFDPPNKAPTHATHAVSCSAAVATLQCALAMGRSAKICRCSAFEKQKRTLQGREWRKTGRVEERKAHKDDRRRALQELKDITAASSKDALPSALVKAVDRVKGKKAKKSLKFAQDAKQHDGQSKDVDM